MTQNLKSQKGRDQNIILLSHSKIWWKHEKKCSSFLRLIRIWPQVEKIITNKRLRLMILFKNTLRENNKRKSSERNKRRSKQKLTPQKISLSLRSKNINHGARIKQKEIFFEVSKNFLIISWMIVYYFNIIVYIL